MFVCVGLFASRITQNGNEPVLTKLGERVRHGSVRSQLNIGGILDPGGGFKNFENDFSTL